MGYNCNNIRVTNKAFKIIPDFDVTPSTSDVIPYSNRKSVFLSPEQPMNVDLSATFMTSDLVIGGRKLELTQ